ncbi:amino acid transporter-like protein [Pseudomassariella vexata]|uniref:Amino acid transporter-like protein n=1 Tax=Pseudomassariella vexata TaxID=1141098 RepID=A0A1Y2DQZ3_9PEZI|nr:amino acid transporter-like protein [Pseudomassariella vexata]ORY61708.1 amino acid transporter-like protein [Pseudomassariella vexata]
MSVVPAANLAIQGGDPRDLEVVGHIAHDATQLERIKAGRVVQFEEYLYYAALTREKEREENAKFLQNRPPLSFKRLLTDRFSSLKNEKKIATTNEPGATPTTGEKAGDNEKTRPAANGLARYGVTDAEQYNASRAFRTASWGTIFYLITTDILGPTAIPWAFAQMGYGPGVALFTTFAVFAWYSGWILWKAFLALDSDRYPLRSYGDYFYRLFGPGARHFINIGQALQQLLTVSALILTNGQGLSQISVGSGYLDGNGVCFIVCLLIFTLGGFILGQIRTLQRFGWLANVSVWINVTVLFICMGVDANNPPNYKAVEASFGLVNDMPITTYAGTPPITSGGIGFMATINGLNQAVYAYGGALLFASFMAEMRHPLDFWKGLLIAQVFIYCVYIFFGIFIYSFQGQYTYNPVHQGMVLFRYQTAGNIMFLITGWIAAALYGNIGLKVVYIEVFQELLGFPPLTDKRGKIWWAVMTPIYWAIAFIICAAVPAFTAVSGFIGALFILSFTYTFPAAVALGFWVRSDAMIEDEESFDPVTGTCSYKDTGVRRLVRGFMKKPLFHIFNFLYMLGALATTGLGVYSSVESLMTAYDSGITTSFSCKSPTG